MSLTTHKAAAESTVDARTRVPVRRTASADPVRHVLAHRLVRTRAHERPPTRRHVAGAPRVIAGRVCAPRQRLPLGTLVALGVAVCFAVVGLGALAGAGAGSAEVPRRTEVVWVRQGESLADIAEREAPASDPAAVVDRIRELNGGLVDGVRPGQPLRVPSEG